MRDTDFDDPQLHMLAQKLLAGSSPAAILAECETEQQRVAYSEAFALNAEITQDNAAAVAEDCLRTIRQARLQRQIDDIRAQLDTCGSAEKGRYAERTFNTVQRNWRALSARYIERSGNIEHSARKRKKISSMNCMSRVKRRAR